MADILNARKRASEVLRYKGVSSRPIDVLQLAQDEGLSVVYQPLDERASGVLVCDGSGAVIGVNSVHPEVRQRFTIAHELAHYYLHSTSPTVYIDDASVQFRVRGGGAHGFGDSDQEAEANAFAAALLMPSEMIFEDLEGQPINFMDDTSLRSLATRYKVSEQALLLRLVELGLMSGIQYAPDDSAES